MKSLLMLLLFSMSIYASSFPEINGRLLSDKKTSLPQKEQYQLLIMGFGMASAEGMTQWVKSLNLSPSSNINWLQVPVIGSVPPFVDGFIKGGMKNSVSENIHAHYFPYFGNKKNQILTSIHGSETLTDEVTPYIVLISPTANIQFSKQMEASTSNIQEVSTLLENLPLEVLSIK